jgi:hypothetical protein
MGAGGGRGGTGTPIRGAGGWGGGTGTPSIRGAGGGEGAGGTGTSLTASEVAVMSTNALTLCQWIFVKCFLRTKLSYYLVYVDRKLSSLPFVHVLLASSSENIERFNTWNGGMETMDPLMIFFWVIKGLSHETERAKHNQTAKNFARKNFAKIDRGTS